MTRNLPSIREIAGNPDALVGLSVDALAALMEEAEAENKTISAAKRAITAHVEKAWGSAIAGAYQAQGKDFGSIRISEGGFEIVVDTPKKVEWDGDKLAAIEAAIRDSGDNPAEYIAVDRKVDERKYAAWPAHIRETFEDARTVKPGTRTVKLVRKEAA